MEKLKQLFSSFYKFTGLLFILFIVVITLAISIYQSNNNVNKKAVPAKAVEINDHILQTIIYQNPTGLTLSQIGERFGTAIMSRGKFQDFLPGYLSVGIKNNYVYLIADNTFGPLGLASVSAQTTYCTSAQKSALVTTTNNVTMDVGDFCKIHDAIVSHTCLAQYPNLCPTEDWFLHKSDGSRYYNSEGMYRVNHGNPGWQAFFAERALREVVASDPNHPALTGVTGIFLDNLNGSFSQLISLGGGSPPKEFPNNDLYDAAMVQLTKVVSQKLAGHPFIGNLNDLETSWVAFAPYLTGGFSESWGSYWGSSPSLSYVQTSLTNADQWIAQGKTLYLVTQGNISTGNYNLFGLALALLVYRDGVEYRFADGAASYAGYQDIPEYLYTLGQPLGDRVKLSDSPLVYQRCYTGGSVKADLTNKTGVVTQQLCDGTVNSPTPTTVTPTITPTKIPTLSPIPTMTPSPTPTKIPTSTPIPTVIVPTSTPVPTRTPTPLPTLTPVQVSSTVTVYAAGNPACGTYPTMVLTVNGSNVLTAYGVTGDPISRVFKTYSYTSPVQVTHNQVKVRYINDKQHRCYNSLGVKEDRNLTVDKITIDGIDFQTESPSVYGSGVFSNNRCRSGYFSSEKLSCNGYFGY